jgi:hypothetical protein
VLSNGKAFFHFLELTKPVSLFLKKWEVGLGQHETGFGHPPSAQVCLPGRIWRGAGVFTKPRFGLIILENFLISVLDYALSVEVPYSLLSECQGKDHCDCIIFVQGKLDLFLFLVIIENNIPGFNLGFRINTVSRLLS